MDHFVVSPAHPLRERLVIKRPSVGNVSQRPQVSHTCRLQEKRFGGLPSNELNAMIGNIVNNDAFFHCYTVTLKLKYIQNIAENDNSMFMKNYY